MLKLYGNFFENIGNEKVYVILGMDINTKNINIGYIAKL